MSREMNQRQARLEQIIANYLQTLDLGQTPDQETYLTQHPDLADELREFFQNQAEIAELAAEPAGVQALSAQEATFLTEGNPAFHATLIHQTEPTLKGRPPKTRVGYFGDYELLAEIARGGMGVVYKARQANLDRIVAVKMILAGQFASDDDVKRFHLEAEAAANLDHTNIVSIYEVGQHEGQHYFSMGYIDGPSLAAIVADGPLPSKEAAAIVEQIAEAIAYAHGRGVIHRDLKPANVLMARLDGGSGQRIAQAVTLSGTADHPRRQGHYVPKVTDFGLAKKIEGGGELTGTGQILGTPSYMPPEQASGHLDDFGASADIYSLGAILYCLLTGRPPFQSASVMDTLLQVLEQDPISPRQLNPQVPKDLETICLKCLQKDRRKRYATAQDLADELSRFQGGEPILARPVGRLERGWRWCQRKPIVASLISLAVLLLVLGTVVSSYFAIRSQQNADAAFKLAGEKSALAGEKSRLAESEHAAKERADQARHKAEEDQKRAEQARKKAEQAVLEREAAQRETSRHLYIARMNLAQRAWEENNVGRVLQLLEATRPENTDGQDFRGFEWHYVERLCHLDQMTIPTGDYLRNVATSPDGRLIASAGRRLQLWDAATGAQVFSRDPPGQTHALAFSPDGTLLATGGTDRIVRLWDVATGQIVHEFEGHKLPIRDLAFHPSGDRLASAAGNATDDIPETGNGEIAIWDLRSGKLIRSLPKQDYVVFAVKYNLDGTLLASGDRDGWIRLWNPATGKQAKSWRGGSTAIIDVDISPDGQSLACGGWGGSPLRIYSFPEGDLQFELEGHAGLITSVAFHPDGIHLVSGSTDQTLILWDVRTGKPLHQFRGHTQTVSGVAWKPGEATIVSAANDGNVKVWNKTSSSEEARELGESTYILPYARLVYWKESTAVVYVAGDGLESPRSGGSLGCTK